MNKHQHYFSDTCKGVTVQTPTYAKACKCPHCGPIEERHRTANLVEGYQRWQEDKDRPDSQKILRAVDGHMQGTFLSRLEKTAAILELRQRRGWGAVRIGQWLGLSSRTVERHFRDLRERGLM